MTTLSDLTLKQLTAIYSMLSGKPTGPKYFNMKATGVSRLEALLAEKNLTLADALKAAGLGNEPAAELEPEFIVPTTEAAIAEPQPITKDLVVEATPEPEAAPVPETLDAATILASPQASADVQMLVFNYLTGAGLTEAEASAAVNRAGNALKLPATPTTAPKSARSGTKQEIVIEMLRRPEGATIEQMMEATGWLSHTCRGVLAGALKKRLGITVTAERIKMVGPNKKGSPGSYTVYRIG